MKIIVTLHLQRKKKQILRVIIITLYLQPALFLTENNVKNTSNSTNEPFFFCLPSTKVEWHFRFSIPGAWRLITTKSHFNNIAFLFVFFFLLKKRKLKIQTHSMKQIRKMYYIVLFWCYFTLNLIDILYCKKISQHENLAIILILRFRQNDEFHAF